ncbi:MAG: Rrf2 family transcriptional regulator [Limnochordales bacterium]|jgi:Rrf2 family protein|nr:Rrf2 family transcriptional regulator [Bacillota bacterium]
MRVSTRGEYGLRAMLELARLYGNGPIPLKQIAGRQKVSEHYLEQLMSALRKAGLVASVRGAQGGYALARPPEEIYVGDVLRVLEGSIELEWDEREPLGAEPHYLPMFATRRLWRELNARIVQLVDSLTLAELLAWGEQDQAAQREYVYYI